ncbi:MAG: hypothetical protein ISR48_02600 [Alphaproteobacteria bacterium]|nr:hypothetical protein [Alphaproteobacteria bacterium]
MTEQKSLIGNIATAYFLIGAGIASISMCSAAVYYGFGPGAFWNLGFGTSIIGFALGVFFAFLRGAVWPYGIYVMIQDPSEFLPWLFYLWYQ